MSTVLLVAVLAAVTLCVVAVGVLLDRAGARLERANALSPRTDIDEQVAAFRAELNAYEEANRG